MKPRTLFLDIETAPAHVLRFDDYSQPGSVPIEFEVEPPRMLCFAARFEGEKKTLYRGENVMSHEDMVISAWEMLNECEIMVTFNGSRFDIPWLNTEIKLAGLPAPSPYRSLDLYQVAKQFKLPSKKLAYISKRFSWGEGKLSSGGLSTWLGVLAGDKKAWTKFAKYNIGDVDVLIDGFNDMRPWFPAWYNQNIYQDTEMCCPKCGSDNLGKEGYAYTALGKFQRFACRDCGSWSRSGKKVSGGAPLR